MGQPGRSTAVSALDKRRERNRLSQKASRQRQANYIRELEKRLEECETPDDDRVTELHKENTVLRNQLFDLHKKLDILLGTLGTLSHTAATASRSGNNTGATESSFREALVSSNATLLDDEDVFPLSVTSNAGAESFLGSNWLAFGSQHGSETRNIDLPWEQTPLTNQESMNEILMTIPSPTAELSSMTGQLLYGINLPSNLASQSSLASHLAIIKHFLQLQLKLLTYEPSNASNMAAFLLSACVACAWPGMKIWFVYTRATVNLSKILLWRAFPTNETRALLAKRHTPTPLQLTEETPLAIDIIPFPSVRDRLLILHMTDPNLDALICEIAEAFVVEVDLAILVAGLPSTPGFVGVWDLARAIESDVNTNSGSRGVHDWAHSAVLDPNLFSLEPAQLSNSRIPASSADEIFNDKATAREAFLLLKMNKGAVHWRLDPQLFVRHPQLLDINDDPRAHGTRLSPQRTQGIPTPKEIDLGSVSMYREFASLRLNTSLRDP